MSRKRHAFTITSYASCGMAVPVVDSALTIRVLVCHEQPLVRAGLRAVLEREPGIQVVGEADSCGEAVALARHVRPTIVIMDITESCSDVIRAIGLLSLLSVEQLTGIVALVGTDNDEVLEAVQAGASGFLLNSCRSEELVTATRAVVAGEGFITPRIAGWLLSHVASQLPSRRGKAPVPVRGITRRELEILRLIAPGRVSRMVLVGQPCAMGERFFLEPGR
jgi:DNA-binding NarL/FixJ family response regulator